MTREHAVPDAEVLDILQSGKYKVDRETGAVYGKGGKQVTPWWKSNHAFVRLYHLNRARSVSLGKLVWMSVTGCVVPPGWEIHHDDENPENNSWPNLIALHRLDHLKKHGRTPTEQLPF